MEGIVSNLLSTECLASAQSIHVRLNCNCTYLELVIEYVCIVLFKNNSNHMNCSPKLNLSILCNYCWQRCGAELSCGYHTCDKLCHPVGECGKCPRSASTRLCPCGKSSYDNLPCTEEVPCCGDTCEKPLSCGIHQCTEKCHYNDCGQVGFQI